MSRASLRHRRGWARLLVVLMMLAVMPASAKNQGKELSELLLSQLQLEDVHPDSLESNIASLKARRLASADPSEQAVYAAAIGRLYAERMYWRSVGNDMRDSSIHYYALALADKELLAQTKAKKWKPFVLIGKDEGYFGGDMLNVVWRSLVESHSRFVRDTIKALPNYDDMIDFYRTHDLRTGALLLALDSLSQSKDPEDEAVLLRIRDEYADLPLCAEVYLRLGTNSEKSEFKQREWLQQGIERYPKYKRKAVLRNALTRLSDPYFQWNGPTMVYPGKTYDWRFRVRNIQAVVCDGEVHEFPYHDPIEMFTDTLKWKAPIPGTYKIDFTPQTSTKTKQKVVPLHQTVVVSALQAVTQLRPNGLCILVVDAETGKAQPGVTVTAFKNDKDSVGYFTARTNQKGTVLVPMENNQGARVIFQLRTSAEVDLPRHTVYAYRNEVRWQGADNKWERDLNLFTDRAIYRPGQTVHVGGILYEQLDWDARAMEGENVSLRLVDGTGKEVGKQEACTDEMGVFSADFVLPDKVRNGQFHIRAQNENTRTNQYLRVEEYKRPTFEVTMNDSALWRKDSVTFAGTAKDYSGTPLRNARVTGTVRWSFPWFYFHRLPHIYREAVRIDTLHTDDNGRFSYTLALPDREFNSRPGLQVNLDVMSAYGETQHASRWYGRRYPPYQGEPARVDSSFLVKCVVDTFDVDRPARVEVTSTLSDLYLHYTLSAAGKVWKDSVIHFSNGTQVFEIPYRKAYDQSATASFCLVRGERVYTATQTVRLAVPDNQLKMRWDTFRDLLQPGQQEEWRLTLLNPDGTPAKANLMIAMYDASLDYFTRNSWDFDVYRGHREYRLPYRVVYRENFTHISEEYYQKLLKEKPLLLSYINPELFEARVYTRASGVRLYKASAATSDMLKEVPVRSMQALDEDGAVAQNSALEGRIAGLEKPEEVAEKTEEEETLNVSMRENFNETAFFYPSLRTNEQGQVSIAFTLPESLTRWNVLGLAHTFNMNYAKLRREVEARKDLMAQLHLPRFLRPGDETQLMASVRNVSESRQEGRGVLQVLDARTNKVLKTWKNRIRLEAGKDTVLAFDYAGPKSDIVVKWAVEGTTCSDGEQRLLPVLPATMHVTNTVQITAYDPSEQNIDLTGLFPKGVDEGKLTIEYTTHPEQYALQALKPLAQARHKDVLSLASAYYAGMLGQALGVEMPDSTEEYLARLSDLQGIDGGFRWYPGMPESPYLTREVAYLLTRLRMLTGQGAATQVNTKAIHYLLAQRIDSTYLSSANLRNLYIAQYSGVQLSKEEKKKVDFMMKLAKRDDIEEEGYERQALLAIVLKQAGADRKAKKCVREFRKRLVSSPERGTYIEFPKGSFASVDRKLHIHVQLMEALQRMNPEDTLLRGMRRYLLQQKRTQEWNTPVNTANAVFALMDGRMDRKPTAAKDLLTLTRKNVSYQNLMARDDSLGYICDSVMIDARHMPVGLRVQKHSEGESWGGVFADFEQPFDQVETRQTGLSITQEYPATLVKGRRCTVRYRISADRDYEYVTLILPRPAALEPVYQLSGYRWGGGLGYYQQMHDAEMELNFYQIPRGDYLIEEDFYVERTGQYHTGVSVIRCEYAEEFQGHSKDVSITIK